MHNSFGKCFGCYEGIDKGFYHQKCALGLFGSSRVPELNTTIHEVEDFAHQFLAERLAVTGVQRKLSLQLHDEEALRFTIIGSLGGGYIMKPPSPEYDQMPENEDLSMHLAHICGI